ncbi:MAG: glycosyl hydrolase family 18 protein, partial [Dehalococcoidia bacterium]|nr:glycosyl hydrolase family 18 protein [Dehalococcoidia bacterium]
MRKVFRRETIADELGVANARALLAVGIVVSILIMVAIFLPPISLLDRLSGGDGTSGQMVLLASGGSSTAAGLTIEVRSGALDSDVNVKVQQRNKGQKVEPLPQNIAAASAVFELTPAKPVNVPFSVVVTLDEPSRLEDNLDVFALQDGAWNWIAGAALSGDGQSARASLGNIPSALIVGRIATQQPSIAGWLPPKAGMDFVARDTVDVVNPLWHVVNDDGSLAGSLTALPSGKFAVYPTIQNQTAGVYSGETLNRILRADDVRQRHVTNIVNLAKSNQFGGVDINYQNIDPLLRDKFTAFVSDLATSLHREQRRISLVLPLPQKSSSGWDTGAYDWQALGKVADYVVIAAEPDQSLYSSRMPEVLAYATSQIDRRKLNLMASVLSHEKSKSGIKDLSLAEALDPLIKVEIKGNSKPAPGETIIIYSPNLMTDTGASGVLWNNDTKTVGFSYAGSDGQQTVWLENSFSLAFKLQYVKQFNLRGVSVQNLGDGAADKDIAAVLQVLKTTGSVPLSIPNDKTLSAQWKSSDGGLSPGGAGWTNWTAPNNPGATYTLTLSVSDGISSVSGARTLAVAVPATPTPTFTPTSTPRPATATPAPTIAAPSATARVGPTDTPPTPTTVPATATPVFQPGQAKYPGLSYGMQLDQGTNLPRALQMVKSAGFTWAKIQIRWDGVESSKGNINWGYLDGIVNQMSANGVRVLFSFTAAPRWSTPADYTDPGPPRDPQDLANFVGAIAAHYPGRVHAYEIWNEQNVFFEWGGRGKRLNATKYVELLKASYYAVKAADPNAVVVSGGLTPTGWNDGDTAYDDLVYMDMMYQAGVKDYCDAIGVHGNVVMPYAANLAAGANGDHGSFYFRRFEQIRDIMVKYGDQDKQMW